MTITNNMGLPQALVDACKTERHNRQGSVSATTLLKGAKEIILTDRHWDELEDDVADRIWAVFGTAVHALLEKEEQDTFTEERLECAVGDKTVTGQIDCYDMKNGIIFDYKTASTWKVIYKDFEDWRMQGLVYAWLLNNNGFPVKECRFVAMLKDHSKTKAKTDRSYPQSPVYVYSFSVKDTDLAEIDKFIRDKVADITEWEKASDDNIPPCSEKERWAKPTKYALMKEGRKTAVKLYDTKEEAEAQLAEGMYIEERKGADGKCPEYCSCCEFCNYYREHYKDQI